jgi:hypothetical protein
MKRTKAQIVGTPFFEFYKSTNNIDDINTAENLLYGMLTDQNGKIERQIKQSSIKNNNRNERLCVLSSIKIEWDYFCKRPIGENLCIITFRTHLTNGI